MLTRREKGAFNFALGMFIPSAFRNIGGYTFIVFGCLCIGAAIQAALLYPETARKSLEEIEIMFRPDGPKAWQTKPGQSHLEVHASEIAARKASIQDSEGKAQILHKDGTLGAAESTERNENIGSRA